MKGWFREAMLAAAIMLPALSGAASAGASDDLGCSNATLKSDYAFSVVTGAPGPQAPWVVGLGTFDGKTAKDGTGGFTQIDYPGDGLLMTPPVTEFRTGETGTYMVDRNCTGFMTINLGGGVEIVNALVISNGGRSIDAVVAGFTVGGTPVARAGSCPLLESHVRAGQLSIVDRVVIARHAKGALRRRHFRDAGVGWSAGCYGSPSFDVASSPL